MQTNKFQLLIFIPIFLLFLIKSINAKDEIVVPEQVHITLADRTDSMLVQWVTMKPINKQPFVEYGKNRDNLDMKQPATVDIFNYNNVLRYMFTAVMTNLDYNSTYREFLY